MAQNSVKNYIDFPPKRAHFLTISSPLPPLWCSQCWVYWELKVGLPSLSLTSSLSLFFRPSLLFLFFYSLIILSLATFDQSFITTPIWWIGTMAPRVSWLLPIILGHHIKLPRPCSQDILSCSRMYHGFILPICQKQPHFHYWHSLLDFHQSLLSIVPCFSLGVCSAWLTCCPCSFKHYVMSYFCPY